jgi:hypothetical protein
MYQTNMISQVVKVKTKIVFSFFIKNKIYIYSIILVIGEAVEIDNFQVFAKICVVLTAKLFRSYKSEPWAQ